MSTTITPFKNKLSLYFTLPTYLVTSFKYAITSKPFKNFHKIHQLIIPARSCGFLRPAKAILVPGMYFFGFSRYS